MTKRSKAVQEEEIEEYEVENIADHRTVGKTKRIEYNIKWKGYDSSENTWEPESSVHAEELVLAYWNKHGGIEARDALKGKGGKVGRKPGAAAKRATNSEKITTDDSNDTSSTPAKRRKLAESSSSATTTAPATTTNASKRREAGKKQLPVVKSEEISKDDDTDDEEETVVAKQKQKPSEKRIEEEEEEEEETNEEVDEEQVDDEDNEEEEEEEVDPDDVVQEANYRKDWDWKTDIEKVVEVQNVDGSEKKNSYRALIKWKDGKYSLHSTEIIRSKCPQQLIDYYESKLVFEKK